MSQDSSTLKVSVSLVVVAIGIILTLVGTVYAISVADLKGSDADQMKRIDAVEGESKKIKENYGRLDSTVTITAANVATLCKAFHLNCVEPPPVK